MGHTHRAPQRFAAILAGGALLLGGCSAAEQRVDEAIGAVEGSLRGEADRLLERITSSLPMSEDAVSEENRAAFRQLREDLEQVEGRVVRLLAAPDEITAEAVSSLRSRVADVEAAVEQRVEQATGISAGEQQAWRALAESAAAIGEQLQSLANLVG